MLSPEGLSHGSPPAPACPHSLSFRFLMAVRYLDPRYSPASIFEGILTNPRALSLNSRSFSPGGELKSWNADDLPFPNLF